LIFDQVLRSGKLIKRYKRFLADILFDDGILRTVHCPNTGAMTGCAEEGSQVWCSLSLNLKRKYPFTWELVALKSGGLACINTHRANGLVEEAILQGRIPDLGGYQYLRKEVSYGKERSRIDIKLCEHPDPGIEDCYVEVKSVTLRGDADHGIFPDTISLRAHKHLRELMEQKQLGSRAVLFFCVNRTDICSVGPADDIDPEYGRLLRESVDFGVEVIAMKVALSVSEILLSERVPVVL